MFDKVANVRRAVLAAAVGFAIALPGMPSAAYADTPPVSAPDGLSQATAGASCWEIKQLNPTATDGVYWIGTAALGAPQQFYCDQSTDGGGWVLVGRGRDGWSESNLGSGTPAQVRGTVTGTGAFAPKQLSSDVIDDLLNHTSVNSLPDGIRLHRATNTAGTAWQDLSFTLGSPRDTWTWQFYNNQRVKTWSVGGVTFPSSSTTSDFGSDNYYNRVSTTTGSTQGWQYGFGFGSLLRGAPSSDSYLWAKDINSGNPRPFTQIFLRPKLMSDQIYSPIPAQGTPTRTNEAVAQGFALPQTWGVAGLGAGPRSIEGSNEVSAFAQVGNVVYVGGNFTYVQQSASGTNRQSQAYLAAFNATTGEWMPSFTPTLDNQVKALAAMPDGRIAVGGYFGQVNGQPRSGLAVLNATTGQLDLSFSGGVINHLSGQSTVVRALDVQGGWLYATGAFTHSTGGATTGEVYTRGAARFATTSGTPDQGWNPELNGNGMAIDASAQGDQVYVAGYFTQSKATTTNKAAALNTTNAQAFNWNVHLSSSLKAGYQQAIKEVGDRVWVGGSEHSLFSYNRNTFALIDTRVGQRGGDFQAIASDGHSIYAGCHCFDAMYEGASLWPNVGNSWTSADAIYAAGAWSAASGARQPDFSPELNTRNGAGAWALFVDSNGTLWEGGDISYSNKVGYAKQWSGGFVRFAQTDTTAPTVPMALKGSLASDKVSLSWSASSGDPNTYEVLRDDRVVASTSDTFITLASSNSAARYFVRAVDAAGNRSASTPATLPTSQPADAALITPGSQWKYLYSTQGPGFGWTDGGFDDSNWTSGLTPVGWGQVSLGTTLTTSGSQTPLATFFRKSFNIVDATKLQAVKITTRADDGVIVYVNGTEVLRRNMDPGASGAGAYANKAVSASSALATPVVVDAPGNLFVTGANVVTAEVHSNYRTTPSQSFELSATAVLGTQPPPPPPVAGPVLAEGSTWSYYFSNTPVPTSWNAVAAAPDGWSSGAAPLGWGQKALGTTLVSQEPSKPITSYFRRNIDLNGFDFSQGLTFTTRADDGIILYVNGTEVHRTNMDPGSVTGNSYANKAVSAAAATTDLVTFTVPASAFSSVANVVAVEVHSNYRSTPSQSFELQITEP